MDTPPAQRAITPATPVRLTVRDQMGLIAVLVGATFAAAVWATTLQLKVSSMDARMARIERALWSALGIRAPTAAGASFGSEGDNP